MIDIVAYIDELAEPGPATCGQCGAPITSDGPSDLFCNEVCQERWHDERKPEMALPVGQHPRICGWRGTPMMDAAGVVPPTFTHTLRGGDGPEISIQRLEVDWAAHRERLAAAAALASVTFRAMSAAIDSFLPAFRAYATALTNAGVLPEPAPTDPKARALELRRNRNTGPAPGPRRIDAARSRRRGW